MNMMIKSSILLKNKKMINPNSKVMIMNSKMMMMKNRSLNMILASIPGVSMMGLLRTSAKCLLNSMISRWIHY